MKGDWFQSPSLFYLSSDFTTCHKSDIIINDTVVMQCFQQIVQLEKKGAI